MQSGNRSTIVVAGVALLTAIAGIAALLFHMQLTESPSAIMDMREAKEVSVTLTDEGFKPSQIRIRTGTSVTFSTTRDSQFWPASNVHPSHDIYPAFDPGRPLSPDESWSFTFNDTGSWGFHDHVRSYFTGSIYVEE
jgi:plastocyanin